MKALILAAGRGTRLKPLTNNKPKILLNFGNINILKYLLDCLNENNINDVYIVAGYRSSQIKKKFKGKIKIIYNKEYKKTNSLYSLFLAKKNFLDTNFFLINGDILISKKYFKINDKSKIKSFTYGLKRKKVKLGEMNIVVKKRMVKNISKNIDNKISNTESAQISFFNKKDSKILFSNVDKLIKNGKKDLFPAAAYEDVIKNSSLEIKYVKKNHWFEVDNLIDYNKLKKTLSNNFKIRQFKEF